MAKTTTLDDLAAMLTKHGKQLQALTKETREGFVKQGKEIHDLTESVGFVVKHMASKEDLAEVRKEMATKEQIIALHTQVNSIETEQRGMKHVKLQARVTDLEEEIFGETRA